MSTTQRHAMESSVALDRLELTTRSSPLGVNSTPRLCAGPQAKETCGASHLNGCVPLSHQVAGHKFGVDKVGILQHPDGTVLKQLQPPPRGPREMQFYSMVYAEGCCDQCLLELQNYLPKYYGTWSSPDNPNDLYLKLEDVTQRFVKPCIMDVKLGQQSYDPFASQEKREQQIRKYPLMEEIGFLVLGMRVYNVCNDTFDSYDQHYGRGLVKDTVKDGLAKFFHNGVNLRKDSVMASIHRVQHILRWFETQHQLNFYASSLLFVYEGLPSTASTLSSSPSPFLSSLVSHTSVSPSVGNSSTVKTAILPPGGDSDKGGEGNARQEGMEQKEKVTEYNNNNIQMLNLASIYTNHSKDSHHHCAKSLHGNSGGSKDALETRSGLACGDNISAQHGEYNSVWKWTRGSEQPLTGNRNKSQLKGRNEDEGEDDTGSSKREEDKKQKAGDAEVEVRMIDFAHVFPSESHDHGYIYGLKHLLSVLEQILSEAL